MPTECLLVPVTPASFLRTCTLQAGAVAVDARKYPHAARWLAQLDRFVASTPPAVVKQVARPSPPTLTCVLAKSKRKAPLVRVRADQHPQYLKFFNQKSRPTIPLARTRPWHPAPCVPRALCAPRPVCPAPYPRAVPPRAAACLSCTQRPVTGERTARGGRQAGIQATMTRCGLDPSVLDTPEKELEVPDPLPWDKSDQAAPQPLEECSRKEVLASRWARSRVSASAEVALRVSVWRRGHAAEWP